MSAFKQIGEAIVIQINARQYDLPLEARYDVRFNLETDITNDFQVIVQPLTRARQRLDRVSWQDTYTHVVLAVQHLSATPDQMDNQKEYQLSTVDELEDQIGRADRYAGYGLLSMASDVTGRPVFSEELYQRGVLAVAITVITSGETRTC